MAAKEDIEAFADLLFDEAQAAGVTQGLRDAGIMGREMGMDIADIMKAREIVHNRLRDLGWVADKNNQLRPT